jgi:hypothetical protein
VGVEELLLKIGGDATGALDAVGQLTDGVDLSMAAVGAAVTAWGVGMTMALSKAGDAAAEYGSEVVKIQRLTGASVEDASTFVAMLDRLGIGADGVSKMLKTLDTAVSTDAQFLTDAGIATRDATGAHRDSLDVLRDVAEHYSTMGNKTDAVAFASQALGRSWVDLLPVLAGGAQGIDDMAKAAQDAGLVLSTESLAGLKEYNTATKDAAEASKGLEIQIGLMTMPVKTFAQDALVTLLTWINKLPKPIKDTAGGLTMLAVGVADVVGPTITFVGLLPDFLDGFKVLKGMPFGVIANGFKAIAAGEAAINWAAIGPVGVIAVLGSIAISLQALMTLNFSNWVKTKLFPPGLAQWFNNLDAACLRTFSFLKPLYDLTHGMDWGAADRLIARSQASSGADYTGGTPRIPVPSNAAGYFNLFAHAAGGYFTGPGIVGDAGGEWAIPQGDTRMLGMAAASMGVGGMTIAPGAVQVHVAGSVAPGEGEAIGRGAVAGLRELALEMGR